MPSSSKKQHNFMAAIANSPAFAKKVGIPQSVGSDFERADKGRKFAKGGETMATKKMMAEGGMMDKSQDKAMIKKAFKQHDAQEHKGGKGTSLELKRGGSVDSASTRADGIAQKGKTKAMQVKMASGGYTVAPNGIAKMASGGVTNSASRRADGIAQKGKTKAMQIKMMNGGKC